MRRGQQPNIALWNCYQLANSLFSLIDVELFERLEVLLKVVETDMTIFYRKLASQGLSLDTFKDAYYSDSDIPEGYNAEMSKWQ